MKMFNQLLVLESISGKARYIRIIQEKDGCFSLNDTKNTFIDGLSYNSAKTGLYLQSIKAQKEGFIIVRKDNFPLTKAQINKHDNYFKNSIDNTQLKMF